MTERERQITKALLESLHELSGGQMTEPLLHGAVNLKLPRPATLAEFNSVLRLCDLRGWIIGLPSRVTGQTKWNLSDPGEAALLEL